MGEAGAGLYYPDNEEDESFTGHQPRECGEHRTVGPHRAWCHDCGEWCYPDAEMACKGCRIPMLEASVPVAADGAERGDSRYSFTRDQLIAALLRLGYRRFGPAEPMADAIIGALDATEQQRAFRAGVRADAAGVGKSAATEGDRPDRGTAENAL